jgi:hypothetical protein
MTVSNVQRRYRLQPDDLAGKRVEATITNVTIEGLESLTPVLHFDRIAKPMILTPGDADDLAYITRSAVMEEWIGQTISIAPIDTEDGVRLAIYPTTMLTLSEPIARPPQIESRLKQWRSILYALLVLLIFLFVFLFENAGDAFARLQSWLQSALPAN